MQLLKTAIQQDKLSMVCWSKRSKLIFLSQALLLSYTQGYYHGDNSSIKPTEGRMITRTACTLRSF